MNLFKKKKTIARNYLSYKPSMAHTVNEVVLARMYKKELVSEEDAERNYRYMQVFELMDDVSRYRQEAVEMEMVQEQVSNYSYFTQRQEFGPITFGWRN